MPKLDPDILKLAMTMADRAQSARICAQQFQAADRDDALRAAARAIHDNAEAIYAANKRDLARYDEKAPNSATRERMVLDPSKLADICQALNDIANQDDVLGETIENWSTHGGVDIRQVRVPIGVLAVIFESRPNVAADAAALAIRSGNAVILRGGSDCQDTNQAMIGAIRDGLTGAGFPVDLVQGSPTTNRDFVGAVLTGLEGRIDLVIPRGGKTLVARVQAEARVAVLGHLDGICHAYLHSAADARMAQALVLNAKMRRTSVCNALECLLIDESRLHDAWPMIAAALEHAGCEIRADAQARAVWSTSKPAQDSDWGTEFLDAIIAVRTVSGLNEALAHIAQHGSGHTDMIITGDSETEERFLASVDSAVVISNATTGLSDGGEFGFGAEIGIATSRLHARGPVGAKQLTTYKYQLRGQGQIRDA
jgi:glutamate-5-semialdehyde dehydrogenase